MASQHEYPGLDRQCCQEWGQSDDRAIFLLLDPPQRTQGAQARPKPKLQACLGLLIQMAQMQNTYRNQIKYGLLTHTPSPQSDY